MGSGYSPDQMRRYWQSHSRLWRDLDRSRDPEGLTNVCFNGSPLWLNRFSAHCQRKTFLRLIEPLGPLQGRRVLDVGCGTGRWSRLLSELGARPTGIDLQSESLRDNSRRLPACRFVEMSADRMALADRSFDLAVSVTVLQHLPDEIQLDALKEVRRVLVGGGRFLMLEATRDRGPHVFSNPPDEWIRKAASARFSLERTLPYDYAPLLYGLRAIASRVRPSRPEAVQTLPDVEDYVARFRRDTRQDGIARRLSRQVLHAATLLSYPVEPLMSAAAPASLAYHVGFLLRAV